MFLNINKPPGITSHDVVDRVRRLTGERTVGHAGTLDPFATGVLIIGVGRSATRELGKISKKTEKEYRAIFLLGKTSSTGDPDGEIRDSCAESRLASLTLADLQQATAALTGEILQRPPRYSAIKIKGVPAYKLARQGKTFELPARKVVVSSFEVLAFAGDEAVVNIVCSSGTYIRSLAESFGTALKTGALVKELARTRVGNYRIDESQTLEALGA